jgi:hypothetical protein
MPCAPHFTVSWPAHYLVVVRDGQKQVFEQLKRALAREPHPTTLIWDRRRGDRRAVTSAVKRDRRRDQRRATPDATWETHHFVVASTTTPTDLLDAYRNPVAATHTPGEATPRGLSRHPGVARLRQAVLAAAMLARRLRALLGD